MRVFTLSIFFLISALFITACNRSLTDERTYSDPGLYEVGEIENSIPDEEGYWARENLDPRAVGELLEEARDARELEYLLNSRNGVNNLDLNGDGYVDYISVREFDDRYDDERGFSLFTMFGPDAIQEVLTIIFDRDGYDGYGYDYPGSRVLLIGNDDIYGDDYYYETNWLERRVNIVDWAFSDHDYYRSPYYYGYYPEYYQPYTIVETTVYRTRIEENYYQQTPVFIQTTQPTITDIKIQSPYRDRSFDKIYANLAKPTKEQAEFRKSNPVSPEMVRVRKDKVNEGKNLSVKPERDFSDKPEKVRREDNPNRAERPAKFERAEQARIEKPNKAERFENRSNPGRVEKQNSPRVERQQPMRVEKQQPMRVERQQPMRTERPRPVKVDRPNPPQAQRQSPPQVQRQNAPQVQRQQQPARVERPNAKPPQQDRGKPQGGGGNKPQGGNQGGGGNGKGKGRP